MQEKVFFIFRKKYFIGCKFFFEDCVCCVLIYRCLYVITMLMFINFFKKN